MFTSGISVHEVALKKLKMASILNAPEHQQSVNTWKNKKKR